MTAHCSIIKVGQQEIEDNQTKNGNHQRAIKACASIFALDCKQGKERSKNMYQRGGRNHGNFAAMTPRAPRDTAVEPVCYVRRCTWYVMQPDHANLVLNIKRAQPTTNGSRQQFLSADRKGWNESSRTLLVKCWSVDNGWTVSKHFQLESPTAVTLLWHEIRETCTY